MSESDKPQPGTPKDPRPASSSPDSPAGDQAPAAADGPIGRSPLRKNTNSARRIAAAGATVAASAAGAKASVGGAPTPGAPTPGAATGTTPTTAATPDKSSSPGKTSLPGLPSVGASGGALGKIGGLVAKKRAAGAKPGAPAPSSTAAGSDEHGTSPEPGERLAKTADKAESIAADTAKVASGASHGAKLGTAVAGPVGTAVGGIAGGAVGALRSKRGRRVLVLALLSSMIPSILILTLVVSMVSIITDTSAASAGVEWNKARAAAIADGVSEEAATIAASAADGTAIPPVVILASAKETGIDLGAEPEEYDEEAEKDAIDSGAPLGPHAFIYDDVRKLATKLNLDKPTFAELIDPEGSSELYARMLGKLAVSEDVPTPLNLGTGVVSTDNEVDDPDSDDGGDTESELPVDTDETPAPDDDNGLPNGEIAGSDPYAGANTHDTYEIEDDPSSQAEAEEVKDDWVGVLEKMPVDDAESRAERIYDQSLQWYLGVSGGCLASGGPAVAGQWANPIAALETPSGSGAFGPRSTSIGGGSGFHDGVDLNGTAGEGSPIYAGGSGIVEVVNSVGYGANWVRIDHGGGIVTEYGHMASATVKTGDTVGAGTQIGTEGNEGTWSEGAHLHLSVNWPENGTTASRGYVDPMTFFEERGITLGSDIVGVIVGSGNPTTGTDGTAPPSQVGADEIRIAQSNIKTSLPYALYKADLDKTVALAPDFISLNEVNSRTPDQITPKGYASWRDVAVEPASQSRGTAVVWRTDRWTLVEKGRVQTSKSPVALDNRWAHWVTLQGSSGQFVSFVATHQMTNPRLFGGDRRQERREKYRAAMEILNDLTESLGTSGPVFIAGDFNSRAADDDPWGPEVMLAKSGLQSSYDALGARVGVVDFIFGQPAAGVTALRQGEFPMNSDHPGLWADYKIGPFTGTAVPPTSTGGQLPSSWIGTSSTGEQVTLDSGKLGYAAQIAATGTTTGATDDAIIIALMTVFVETKFAMYASDKYPETIALPHDLVGSDHDSVGLFQQRPASGWGSPSALMNVEYSTKAFFGGSAGPNGGSPAGLFDIEGWETMPKGTAAQKVQVSAFADRYAPWEEAATELLGIVKGTSVQGATCGGAAGSVPSSYDLGAVSPDAANVANILGPMFGIQTVGGIGSRSRYSCHPIGLGLDFMVPLDADGKAQGQQLADYAVANAASLKIAQVIWYQENWTPSSGVFSPMSDRGSPTENHMDHVHISIAPCEY